MVKHSGSRQPSNTPKNYCFACGPDNPHGMHLKFVPQSVKQKGDPAYTCRFSLSKRYTGPPGYCHGGIIATILDDAMGKINKLRGVIAVTSQMTVDFLKPVPLNKPLHVNSREIRVRGRRHFALAEIKNQKDEVLARSRGVFVAIDPERMFGKSRKR
ncbi:MAG: PaaI family thioesterase [Acidobacteriales bacterium]|nr:PaaI family thioesterase [Terriglobales bacterium]